MWLGFGLRGQWKVTLFSVVCLLVFVRLGFWQLDREQDKIELLAAQERQRHQPPVAIASLPRQGEEANMTPVRDRGRYDAAHTFLLDNRVLDGTVGFEVLVPFRPSGSERMVLVNRGFVPMGRTRQSMPAIPPVATGETTLRGRVYVGEYRDVDPGDVAAALDSATIVQVADPEVIETLTTGDFYPHLIRLAPDDINALPRHWPVTVMRPETHRGYAVQWFAMAAAVAIAWGFFTFGRRRTETQ